MQSELLETLRILLGEQAAEAQEQQTNAVKHGDGKRSVRVLLAEDGLVNQRVAVGLLEMQGHQVVVVRHA